MASSSGGVPPGFRFHPTDEELLHYYLKKKLSFQKFDMEVIREVDLNKMEPWDLQERCRIGSTPQNEWYFFSHKDRKYPTGSRTNRATSAGFWKATGRDKCIRNAFKKIGMRKTLVFYRGRAPHGQKSDWIMHEYRLEDQDHQPDHHEDGWVVCRVFKKKNLFKLTSTSSTTTTSNNHNINELGASTTTTTNMMINSSDHHHHHQHGHLMNTSMTNINAFNIRSDQYYMLRQPHHHEAVPHLNLMQQPIGMSSLELNNKQHAAAALHGYAPHYNNSSSLVQHLISPHKPTLPPAASYDHYAAARDCESGSDTATATALPLRYQTEPQQPSGLEAAAAAGRSDEQDHEWTMLDRIVTSTNNTTTHHHHHLGNDDDESSKGVRTTFEDTNNDAPSVSLTVAAHNVNPLSLRGTGEMDFWGGYAK